MVFPQSKNKNGYFDDFISDTEIFFIDGASFFTYPIRMTEAQWLTTAVIGLSTYYMVNSDRYIQDRIGRKFSAELDTDFWSIFEEYGAIEYAEIAGAATYILGYVGQNDDIRVLGRMMFQSLTYSGITAMFIRMIAGRKRPPFTDDHLNFIGFTSNNSYQSFPSGHTTVAFTLSTTLAEYFDTPLARIGFYGIATLAAAERLINDKHWFTDVGLGALLGIAGGLQ